ncbi:SOS response-associated peptidase [Dietzia sp. PP-33]|uniref:SOS response-associated peptidase n=1 Tax=Dietzia sp. PP-33 TaxID=2957500 RepID=UPI0029A37C5B|nr:SOS response-associated peptidase [Dietzia sp. PP-33]MDX2356663.1 SOS response-associated peptidase [Dietzia sp. PP-33]
MCGRFSLSSDPARLAVELDAVDEASSPPPGSWPDRPPGTPRFNIAPTATIPVLVSDSPRERLDPPAGPGRVLRAMRWGLVPSWARDPARLPTLFNARVETAYEKPSFRSAVARRHCAIPMDGWYEWVPGEPAGSGGKAVSGGKAAPGGRAAPKQPFYMSLPGDLGMLMAGLWEARRDPQDPAVTQWSCTILTTEALGPLRAVHDRMPLVVDPSVLSDWLDPSVIGDPRALVAGAGGDLEQWAGSVEITPVSRAVSNVRNEGPELIRPVDPTSGMLF